MILPAHVTFGDVGSDANSLAQSRGLAWAAPTGVGLFWWRRWDSDGGLAGLQMGFGKRVRGERAGKQTRRSAGGAVGLDLEVLDFMDFIFWFVLKKMSEIWILKQKEWENLIKALFLKKI